MRSRPTRARFAALVLLSPMLAFGDEPATVDRIVVVQAYGQVVSAGRLRSAIEDRVERSAETTDLEPQLGSRSLEQVAAIQLPVARVSGELR